ncbi:spermidine/putrescine ABC transporter substrate-binding protein [Candidatus Thiothrix sp. Deng01]|uniref:Putrescine-binding periplasmic protein n=1 Tax=Candidatus Thiothrix phosphatis TaxID=3112415 RepID=A0ABU6CWV0_9GAMM|nr:spermidine/putrescine ABC transporter substrate-binding protein [Candidatus Thiothrix sp. Deng01]MEB4591310.1 spermidine/putrescine ABC transporter substrate-binding protein [Candidatus Thiothrix sp. Deng01]
MLPKVFVVGLIAGVAVAISPAFGEDDPTVVEKVIVYNWENYIPDGVLEDFTRETGVKVQYSTFDNNEVMYARLKLLKGRGYDVLVPSVNLVGRMGDEGLLQPLQKDKLDNLKYLDPDLLNRSYDPENKFSIPYLWGSTGIGVNTAKVKVSTIKKWEDLWDNQWRGKLLLTDDMGEVFAIALKVTGHSINTTDPEEIKDAYDKLHKLMPNVKVITSDPRPDFLSDKVELGITWNGEMAVLQEKNPAFQYIYPADGASFWIDSFVIPARADNVDNAHKFINYMMRPEVAARCVKDLGYATANLKGKSLLDASLRNNPVIFPPAGLPSSTEFRMDVGREAFDLYQLYWNKLKADE